jgi:hypothetical protein
MIEYKVTYKDTEVSGEGSLIYMIWACITFIIMTIRMELK